MSFLDTGTVPSGKVYLRPIPATANPNQYLSDAEWNAVMQYLLDIRAGIITAPKIGMSEQASAPAAYTGGSSSLVWAKNDGQLVYRRSGVDGSIPNVVVSTKGDIAVWNGTAWVKVAAGNFGQVLTADSAQAAGVLWKSLVTEQTVAAAASININPAAGESVRITLSATAITTITSNSGYGGETIRLQVIQDSTGGRSISGWNSSFQLAGGTYTPTATANKRDILTFVWDSFASKWCECDRSMNV